MGDALVLRDPALDFEELALMDLHPDDREDIESELRLVQERHVSRDDAVLLESPDPVRDRADARVDFLRDVPEGIARVHVQEAQDPNVEVVESVRRCHGRSVPPVGRMLELDAAPRDLPNNVPRNMRIPVICTVSAANSLYMFKFLGSTTDGRWVRPGGKGMAIASSTPAKSKKMTVASALKRIETEGIRWIDLQFVDLLGALQHITIPSTSLGPEEFKRGVGKLDGSSIKGFKEIHESDMVMDPDPSTFAVLPWYDGAHKTARFFVDVYEGGSHERFTRDSRYMAQRAVQFAADQGYDTTYWGPEIEFFVFDGIRMLPTADAVRNPWSGAGYEIISREAPWQASDGKNFPIWFKEGYYPAPPVDSLQG